MSMIAVAAVFTAGATVASYEQQRRGVEHAKDTQKEQEDRFNKAEAEAKLKKDQNEKRIDATRARAYQRASLSSSGGTPSARPSMIGGSPIGSPGGTQPSSGVGGGNKTMIGA